ncbi:prolyl oligopeptidase family serine peptidase [Paenibacillus sp. GCM10023248]|uniref:S9 family peptidase n=1 Tax=unclassified Paenibacillus TaxID=185978 RepID=UPI0023785663|nr:prolyl oligopeptidase family serine peptidase [Paenibacillus sp. MAHUQ-63]MDD9271723.1 prolyl oligopeptidase family serine peptidase [Paenibacillus sp. MAHUQ-63]
MDNQKLIEEINKLHYHGFLEIAVSPDDKDILVVFGSSDVPEPKYAFDEYNRSIWKYSLESKDFIQMTLPEEDSSKVTWSPHGQKFAYTSLNFGQKELCLMDRDGSGKQILTQSKFSGRDPFNGTTLIWSPNSQYLAYVVMPFGSKYGLVKKFKEYYQNPSEIYMYMGSDDLNKKIRSELSVFESELHIIDVNTLENKKVFSIKEKMIKIEHWSPEGNQLIFSIGDELKSLDLDNSQCTCLYKGRIELIQFTGNEIIMAKRIANGIQVGNIANGEFQIESAINFPSYNIILHTWSNDGAYLFFSAQEGVTNALYRMARTDSKIKQITPMNHIVWSPMHRAGVKSFHHSSNLAFPLGNPSSAAELVIADLNGNLITTSEINQNNLFSDLKVEIIHYRSGDEVIEGILVFPPNINSEIKSCPILVYLHGGPANGTVTANLNDLISARGLSAAYYLALHGYVIFLPNFRGSGGYGDRFKEEASGLNLMHAPYEDVIAGIEYLINQGIADPDKLGIYGSSFGAMLATWIVSKTSMFKGAAAAVGVYDLLYDD